MREDSERSRGRLFVLEGADGVGKSTLAGMLAESLCKAGIPCQTMSFPGKDPGTLGLHVYRLHHDPSEFGIMSIDPTSMQVLHIAAHIAAIESQIRPLIERGVTIVLDRFWWSTWVYGVESGVQPKSLELMISLERVHWQDIAPDMIFLVQRNTPFRPEHSEAKFSRLTSLYLGLAGRHSGTVKLINNNGPLENTATCIMEAAISASR